MDVHSLKVVNIVALLLLRCPPSKSMHMPNFLPPSIFQQQCTNQTRLRTLLGAIVDGYTSSSTQGVANSLLYKERSAKRTGMPSLDMINIG